MMRLSEDISDFAAALLGPSAKTIVIEADSLPCLRGAFELLAAQARALEIRLDCLEAIERELDVMPAMASPAADTGGDEAINETMMQAAAHEIVDAANGSTPAGAPLGGPALLPRADAATFADLVSTLPPRQGFAVAGVNVVLLNPRRPAFCDGRGPAEGGAA